MKRQDKLSTRLDLLAITIITTFLLLQTFQIFRGYNRILSLIGIVIWLVYLIIVVRRVIIESNKNGNKTRDNY